MRALSDPDRRLVKLHPRNTTIAKINRLTPPNPVPTRRTTAFQRHAWDVVAQIVRFRLDQDGWIELVLFDGGAYVRAGMPPLGCLTDASRGRRLVAATRARFVATCGKARPESQDLGAVGYVTGVGFWSRQRPPHEAAVNGAELQPVTGLRLIAGCR